MNHTKVYNSFMKIFSLDKEAIRPRILLLDFEKSDAQSLRDCGYKVHLGSTGLKGDLLNIPTIEPHQIDIAIYRLSYETPIPKPKEKIRLESFCAPTYLP